MAQPIRLCLPLTGLLGTPDKGCRADEEVLLAGSGRICAPKISVAEREATDLNATGGAKSPRLLPPTPLCELGGAAPSRNGCPVDAPVDEHSQAWPICLAKANVTDPYMAGLFHCLLVCPCYGEGADCGARSHAHCPQGATCQRGELRQRAQGVCAYHGDK